MSESVCVFSVCYHMSSFELRFVPPALSRFRCSLLVPKYLSFSHLFDEVFGRQSVHSYVLSRNLV